jgi:hypothetical protein
MGINVVAAQTSGPGDKNQPMMIVLRQGWKILIRIRSILREDIISGRSKLGLAASGYEGMVIMLDG